MRFGPIPVLLLLAAVAAHAAPPNRIANPEIAADLSGWIGQGGAISRVALDVFGRSDSGSAQLTASVGISVTLAQCVALPANAHVDFGAWIEIPSFQLATGAAVVMLEWWNELGCGGMQVDVAAETATISATGRWSYAALRDVTPPTGAQSAKLKAVVLPNATGFLAHVDSLFVAPAGALFVPAVGEILVADGSKKIIKVEPATGAQRLVNRDVGFFARPTGVAIDSDGLIWVTNAVGGTPLVTVDPATGLQDAPATTGAALSSPWDVDVAADGSLWIAGNGLWQVTLPGRNVVLRKSLATTAYAAMVDPEPATGAAKLVSLALGSAGIADFDVASGDLTTVAGTPTAPGRYDHGIWMPPDSSTRVFTEVEPIAPSGCNAAASGVLAIDGGPPILGGNFRCPRGLASGGPDEPGYASDGSAFTGSQEGQIISIDRAGAQTLVTRSGFLVDPWDVEVVPEPGDGAIAWMAVSALAALSASRTAPGRPRFAQPGSIAAAPTATR
jgi:hypothetical protein